MKEKISVIIPIYNVEKYFRRCLESILAQTYQELEIILVDDESPDNCGVICDEYAEKDTRIKVIHKKNGGLSDARNAGLDIATGDLIAFVDSDDWVEAEYIQTLYDSMKKAGSDIVVCSFYRVVEEKRNVFHVSEKEKVYEGMEALKLLLLEKKCPNYAWNKLYRKKIFETLRFPKGKIWEDVYIMGDAFCLADKISFIDIPLYNYVSRENSIIGSAAIKDYIAFFEVILHRYNRMKSELELLPYLQYSLVQGYRMELYHMNWKMLNKNDYNVIMEHRMLVKHSISRNLLYPLLTWKQKIMFEMGLKIPRLATAVYDYQKKIKKNRGA